MTTLDERLTEMVPMNAVISNSEVGSYTSCEMKHYFAFGLSLEPKKMGDALSRGIIGHEALAVFYKNLNELGHEASSDLAITYVMQILQAHTGKYDEEMLRGLLTLLQDYFEFYEGEGLKPILVEEQLHLQYLPDVAYGMRLDFYGQYTKGPKAGKFVLMDHKFVYDFKTQDMLRMNAQMPKYKAVLENNGYRVDECLLNQIRHRTKKGPMTPDEKFRREVLTFTQAEVRNVMREQVKAADRIMELRKLPIGEWKDQSLRAMGEFQCRNCSFINLCKTDLIGQPINLMVQTEFSNNTYRYKEEE